MWICGDFKITKNSVLKMKTYPMPQIEDIFGNLSEWKRFSKIDLSQAYLQMEMEEDFKAYLTITTQKGLYQYNRLVFCIAFIPAIWHRAMDQVLQGILRTECYLDDIIVTDESDEERLKIL